MPNVLSVDLQTSWGTLQWKKNPPAEEWDRALAWMGGHPLQSCLWGDARRDLEGIVQHRWLARQDGEVVWMIRVEERKVLGHKIAWAPRGPVGRKAHLCLLVPPGFEKQLRAEGFSLLISDPWVRIEDEQRSRCRNVRLATLQTIWIDLSVGRDLVFKNMHKHVRNGIRHAGQAGIRVEMISDQKRIVEFVNLCRNISTQKGFELRVTSASIEALLSCSNNSRDVEAALFATLKDNTLGAGLFILRAGQSVHLIAAATNRDLRKERVGEACHWGVIEWGIGRGCTRYDLEGIDPVNNTSVYHFKKRLGGEEITLPGHVHTPLKFSGRVMSWLIAEGMTRRIGKRK